MKGGRKEGNQKRKMKIFSMFAMSHWSKYFCTLSVS